MCFVLSSSLLLGYYEPWSLKIRDRDQRSAPMISPKPEYLGVPERGGGGGCEYIPKP